MTLPTYQGNLAVIGATAGGVAAAVTAARQGLSVILVANHRYMARIFASLGAIETHYPGVRSPLLEEIIERIREHYRTTYGPESEQFQTCTRLDPNNPMITFEPHVLTRIIHIMVEAEPGITCLVGYYPSAVELQRDTVRAVILQTFEDALTCRVEADTFIDSSYEGDLAALAGVLYRVGRESRRDYDEPHAGRMFTRWVEGRFPTAAARGELNILPKWTTLGLMSGSTGEGDDNIQAYSYRLCISSDPGNRRRPEKPAGYDRQNYLGIVEPPDLTETKRYALHHRFLTGTLPDMIASDHIFHGHALPNHKRSWNATNFPGAGKAYPDADWPTRDEIARRHVEHALGIMYFLQNDPEVPPDIQARAREWGLALDEFTDNDNIPHQMYIREARRMVGRTTYSGGDCTETQGLKRAPINGDSVAITEFPLDSLACTTERRPGSLCDGQMFLMEISRPGQVPYRVMLPERIDNLLVSVTASVTHIAWGTIRQTPTLIQLCEAAGMAAVLAQRQHTTVGTLDVDHLQRALVEHGSMITFFNEFDMRSTNPWVAGVQYLGTKGFFNAYHARPEDPLTRQTAQVWADTIRSWSSGMLDATARARQLPDPAADAADTVTMTASELIALLDQRGIHVNWSAACTACGISDAATISRGDACQLIYVATAEN